MLTEQQQRAAADASREAVAAYEKELLEMIAEVLLSVDAFDPLSLVRTQVEVQRRAVAIQARHRVLILEAVKRDFTGALAIDRITEQNAIENA